MSSNIYDCALNGNAEELRRILSSRELGKLLDRKDSKNGMAPLHWAANGGKLQCIKILLEFGAYVDITDEQDFITPLHIAAARGFAACVQCLIQHNANANAASNRRETPLHVASWAGHFSCVRILLDNGAIVNVKESKLGDCPLHQAAAGGHFHCVVALLDSEADVNMRNRKGLTALHMAATANNMDCFTQLINQGADPLIRGPDGKSAFSYFKKQSRRNQALVCAEFSHEQLLSRDFELWFYLLKQSGVDNLDTRIEYYAAKYPDLASAVDSSGRSAVEVASRSNKLILRSKLLWHGRFKVISESPEHASASCVVFRALDEAAPLGDNSDSLGESPSTGTQKTVAIKLMRFRSQFAKEVALRQLGTLADYIVDVHCCNPAEDCNLGLYPEDVIADFSAFACPQSLAAKTVAESLYCTVMPFADRTLAMWMRTDCSALRAHAHLPAGYYSSGQVADLMPEMRSMFNQIIEAVDHLHSLGIIHGDLSANNIVKEGRRWKLLDLDSASRVGIDYVNCSKATAAICPPEAVKILPRFSDEEREEGEEGRAEGGLSEARVLLQCSHLFSELESEVQEDGSSSLLLAHESFDIWSLGCILYSLCAREFSPLFVINPSLDDSSVGSYATETLLQLRGWSEELKSSKLSLISDPLAKNLLVQVLRREPRHRISLSRFASHPFLSLRDVPRLLGEKALYDVYIGHRGGEDDFALAAALYSQLVEKSVSVWWAPKSLPGGNDSAWRDEFASALVNSSVYVPLVSRAAINNPSDRHRNFSKLNEMSACNDSLLEYRLALELKHSGHLDSIRPILVGDLITVRQGQSRTFQSYFESDCCPVCPHVVVAAVEGELVGHVESLGLGLPELRDVTVHDTVAEVLSCDGIVVEGTKETAVALILDNLLCLLADIDEVTMRLTSPGLTPVPASASASAPHRASYPYLDEQDQFSPVRQYPFTPIQHSKDGSPEKKYSPHHSKLSGMGGLGATVGLSPELLPEVKGQLEENRLLRQRLVPMLAREELASGEISRLKQEKQQAHVAHSREVDALKAQLRFASGSLDSLSVASFNRSSDMNSLIEDSSAAHSQTAVQTVGCSNSIMSLFGALSDVLKYI